MAQSKSTKFANKIFFVLLLVFTVIVLYPLFFILNNSFSLCQIC